MKTDQRWEVREDGGQLEIVARKPRTTRIAVVCADGDATDEDRQTAELLAQAPALRRALVEAIEEHEAACGLGCGCESVERWAEIARAAGAEDFGT